jgi:hypothetical protein
MLFVVAAGALLTAGLGAWGFQQLGPEAPVQAESALDPVGVEKPIVAPPPAEAAPEQEDSAAEAEPTKDVDAPSPESGETAAAQGDEERTSPAEAEQTAVKPRKPPSRKAAVRKPRPRRKATPQPLPEPIAKALPGHVKIITKGHSVEIYKGSKLLGKAPALITLPAGRHLLRLKSIDSGESMTLPVNVVANATKTISLDVN